MKPTQQQGRLKKMKKKQKTKKTIHSLSNNNHTNGLSELETGIFS